MTEICTFTEPVHNIELKLHMKTPTELTMSPFQRKQSDNFVKKLSQSISLGFFVPLLVVRDEDGNLVVIDGQHRILAMIRAKGNFPIPCIELPQRYMYHALIYNVELADKIKDICTKAFYIYENFVNETPEVKESKISDYFRGIPYYISLGYAHVEQGLSSPSLVETSIKKFDGWIDLPLKDCREERIHRGHLIALLEDTVNNAAKAAGFSDYFLKQAIVSKTNKALWGMKRTVDETFNNAMDMMIDHIEGTSWEFLGR